jgi:hypothetical protein
MLYIQTMNWELRKHRRMVVAITGYLLALLLTTALLKEGASLLFGLILILPLLYLTDTVLRSFSGKDEMFRIILTEAMTFSALATGFTCLSYCFVRKWGYPEFQAEWAFYMIWFYYGVGSIWVGRKYG